ncbi:unnamed protein product, partial [Mesorhabditis spiculigera]
MASKKYTDLLTKLYKSYQGAESFQRVAGACRVTSVSEGKVRLEFDVEKNMTNPFGTLHGGYTATLIDIATTTALLATERAAPGVSVDLHVSYLGAAKLGETVVLDAEIIKAGRTTAFTKASLFIKDTDKQIATGLHTKALPRN